MDALEVAWKRELMGFADLYDKTYHMLKRTEKRLRDAQKHDQEPERGEGAAPSDPVTEKILARRRQRGVSQVAG